MASPNAPFSLVEKTDFCLRVVRCAGRTRPLRIDALREFTGGDLAAQGEAIAALVAGSAELTAVVRPRQRQVHLSSPDEAKRYGGAAGARQFAAGPAFSAMSPGWLAIGPASSDAADPRWLLELASVEARADLVAALAAANLKPTRWVSAHGAVLGAIAVSSSAPTWVIDVGEIDSHATLLAKSTTRITGPVSLTLDKIAEAVQLELGLKFRGSAAKLFFNDQYDFNDIAAKIAQRLAPGLQTELTALRGKSAEAPVALACLGLPENQQWLGAQLADALGLTAFQTDMKAWSESAGILLPESSAGVTRTSWLPLLQLASVQATPNAPAARWQSDWVQPDEKAMAKTSAVIPASPIEAVVKSGASDSSTIKPVPAGAASASHALQGDGRTAVAQAPAAAVKASIPPISVVAESPSAAVVQNRKSSPAKTADAPARQNQAVILSTPVAKESSVNYQPKSNGGAKAGNGAGKNNHAPVATPPPPQRGNATPTTPVTTNGSTDTSGSAPARRTKGPLFIGIAIACVVIGGGGYFFLQSQRAEEARRIAEKQKMEQQVKAEAEKARLALEQARLEAENRKKFELDAMQKLASAETARQQAEAEARAQSAARLANARGSFSVTSDPAGATVTIDGHSPRTTPATFSDLKIGHYKATVSHPLCEPVAIDVEVKENATTDLGVVRLSKVVGALSLNSDPAGIGFEVTPANMPFVAPSARRTGSTPATLDDLAAGDYTVTYHRDGWAAHTEKITITRGGTTQSEWKVSTGTVKITSTPAGATVTRGGATLGVTPLTLTDQTPGDAGYEISLTGFAVARVTGRIERAEVLTLNRRLEPTDHIATLNELDQLPVPISNPSPILSPSEDRGGGSVVVQVVVERDGRTRNAEVLKSSDPALARACLEAVAHWRFKPGTMAGKPVASRVALPFNFESH